MAVLSGALTALFLFYLLYVLPKQDPDDDFEDSKDILKIVGTVLLLMAGGALIGISAQSVLIGLGGLFLLFTLFVFTMRLRL